MLTCEAEYMAFAVGTQETIFLSQLLSDLRGSDMDEHEHFLTKYSDNQNVIVLT